jgi:hypothetical protein
MALQTFVDKIKVARAKYNETFGECARVTVAHDGACTIRAIPSSREDY